MFMKIVKLLILFGIFAAFMVQIGLARGYTEGDKEFNKIETAIENHKPFWINGHCFSHMRGNEWVRGKC